MIHDVHLSCQIFRNISVFKPPNTYLRKDYIYLNLKFKGHKIFLHTVPFLKLDILTNKDLI